ncbi:uncharacterized protein LOC122531012 [Frieseomelitta varia]|uniref:uncharacterized protein LOC122531012 n=1 Tax=Frieseomelitta varia TaxID=561572 RepID=UPI001CB6B0BB|nr:uncharacterized protein LOC122531012 [Frieseomelitta varia]
MASETDAVLRFFCLTKEKIVEDKIKSSYTSRRMNRTNEVEDHVWNHRERTADPLPQHILSFFSDNIATYLRCLVEMHDKSSSRWTVSTRQEQWARGKYCFPGKTRTDTQPDDCGDH